MYQLRQPLPKACHKEIVRQTGTINREDKIAKLVGKTFFYFVSEALNGENNAFNIREALQIDKKKLILIMVLAMNTGSAVRSKKK